MSDMCSLEANKLKNLVGIITQKFDEMTSSLKKDIDADINEVKDDAPSGDETKIGLDFDVKWKDKEISMHIPSVKMVDKSMGSLNLPEFTMRKNDIIFDVPKIVMVDKVVGQYPSITCSGFSCRTVMKDIIISVPETRQERITLSLGIPEVTMKQQEIIVGLPVFEMQLQTFIISIPEIKLRSVSVATEEMKKEAEDVESKYATRIKNDSDNILNGAKEEVKESHKELFNCIKSNINTSKNTVIAQFDASLKVLNDSIAELKQKEIPENNNAYQQIEDSIKMVEQEKSNKISFYDSKLKEIDDEQNKSLESIFSGFKIESDAK